MRTQLLNTLIGYKSTAICTLTATHIKETKILLSEKSKRDRDRELESVLHPDVTQLLPESQEDFMHIPLD